MSLHASTLAFLLRVTKLSGSRKKHWQWYTKNGNVFAFFAYDNVVKTEKKAACQCLLINHAIYAHCSFLKFHTFRPFWPSIVGDVTAPTDWTRNTNDVTWCHLFLQIHIFFVIFVICFLDNNIGSTNAIGLGRGYHVIWPMAANQTVFLNLFKNSYFCSFVWSH